MVERGLIMGCYDTFIGKCPHCGADFDAQTKQEECLLAEFKTGDKINLPAMRLQLKDVCFSCKKPIIAMISDGILWGYSPSDPTHIEGAWGKLEVVGELHG
jgi:hypothetical protein